MIRLEYDKLTTYEVEEFYDFLIKEIERGTSEFDFDFKDIQRIDMVGIQLLISLQQTCREKSINLNLRNFSSNLLEALEASGSKNILEIIND